MDGRPDGGTEPDPPVGVASLDEPVRRSRTSDTGDGTVSYLDQLTDTAFAEREDEAVVFFPYGSTGGAYLIERPARYRHIRRFVRGYLKRSLPTVAGAALVLTGAALWLSGADPRGLLAAAGVLVALLLTYGLHYRRRIRRLVAGLETVDASPDLLRNFWFPRAFPRLYRIQCWGAGFTIAAVVALAYLFPGVDGRLLGLAGGGVGMTAGWAWVRWRA